MEKKEYTKPEIKEIPLQMEAPLLADSGNPFWEDNQPDPDNWWGKD